MRRKVDGAESWMPIYQALNLLFVNEFAWDFVWSRVDEYLELAGMPERTVPIETARALARHQAAEVKREREMRELQESIERRRAEALVLRQRQDAAPPKWGTRTAKQMEIERIRKEIEEKSRK